jgi:hypothetical protein
MFDFLDFATPLTRRLLVTVAVLVLPAVNNGRIIVGYFGDGTIVPNNGYVLVPQDHYSAENFINLPWTFSRPATRS